MIELIYKLFEQHRLISTDSRIISPNSIFFAIKGDKYDGNEFVEKALASGCSAAVSSDKKYADIENVFIVEDTLTTLQELANYHRRKLNIPIIAITGTNGKTTTKELVSTVLAKIFRIAYTSGNKNNHIGLPLTLLSMNKTIDIGVVEMGANHPGEIETLCKIAEPNYGIITNIGKAHLEGFGSLEGVIATKTELYHYLNEHQGKIFINTDNQILTEAEKNFSNAEFIKYGKQDTAYCVGKYLEYAYQVALEWQCNGKKGYTKSNLIGAYNFENILAAVTFGCYFGVYSSAIDNAIAEYMPQNNRSQLTKTTRNTLVLDLYNANPTSMKAAIESYNTLQAKQKELILGDMLELGTATDIEHEAILELVSRNGYQNAYFIGKNFGKFAQKYPDFTFFDSVETLNKFFTRQPEKCKTFLIKGSRGIHLEKVIDYL